MGTNKDKYGWWIWDNDSDHVKWWSKDECITFEELLLKHGRPANQNDVKWEGCPDFVVADDEQVWYYEYGGVLSMRGGFYITKKDRPNWILRSIMTKIS